MKNEELFEYLLKDFCVDKYSEDSLKKSKKAMSDNILTQERNKEFKNIIEYYRRLIELRMQKN